MFYRVKGHCCCSFFFFKKVTVEGLITSVCNQGPATAKEPAEQTIAGSQCVQLARCNGPGSRTVVHLTDEHAQRMP